MQETIRVEKIERQTKHGQNIREIFFYGKDKESIINELIKYIRNKSRNYYKVNLYEQLKLTNIATVDIHAGMGVYLYGIIK